jgi:thiamine pyridinylase
MFNLLVAIFLWLASCYTAIAQDVAQSGQIMQGRQIKPRILRVATYPYVPESAQMQLKIAQDFEKNNPDVQVEFVDLGDYYGGGLGNALDPNQPKVDVVEVDTVFLRDLVESKFLETLPDTVLKPDGTFLPVASRAVVLNGKTFGVPHWVCGNFLFFRKNDPDADRLSNTTTLSDLEQILNRPTTEEQGLLADMRGKSTLGEVYLSSLVDEYQGAKEALAHLGDPANLDPAAAKTPNRIFWLCPGGMNHNAKYHSNGQFYARQFAHCKARAKISYSEDLYYVGDEFLHGVASSENGIGDPSKDEIQVVGAPLANNSHKMLAWVDALCVRAGVTSETRRDAMKFISDYTGEAFNRDLLIPSEGDAPRYLLPARGALYSDSTILKTAPLYPRLKEIIQDAETVTASKLNKRLQEIGKELDKNVEEPLSSNKSLTAKPHRRYPSLSDPD